MSAVHDLLINPVSRKIHSSACAQRLLRVRRQLAIADCDAILLYDPVNIRYATDTSNMQVWTLHNRFRYVVVINDGPTILWEFHNCDHLHDGNPQVTEIRPAISWSYFGAGNRVREKAAAWAQDIKAVLEKHCGKSPRLAIDTADDAGIAALLSCGITALDGEAIMQRARMVKCEEELALMRWTMSVCEAGIARMYEEMRPGLTEQELWAWLHYENIRNGGEWIETRLLVSGARTNPWMQEASHRVMNQGELLCFDTDLIGPYGYCADVSRAWIVGKDEPTNAQRDLYRYAYEQIATNAEILRPGLSFHDFSDIAWPIPERFYQNRYSFVLHGVGMGDEHPGLTHSDEDWKACGTDGVFEENMVVSIESYIGEVGGTEGVKLEQQYLLTAEGPEPFCNAPFNDDWL